MKLTANAVYRIDIFGKVVKGRKDGKEGESRKAHVSEAPEPDLSLESFPIVAGSQLPDIPPHWQGLTFPWWTPARVAYVGKDGWQTTRLEGLSPSEREERLASLYSLETFSPSLVDVDGMTWAICVDVDSPNVGLVQSVLWRLPEGVTPLITQSGTGYHVWILLAFPTPYKSLKPFLRALADVLPRTVADGRPPAIELFPTPTSPYRCIRWFLTRNPKNGAWDRILRWDGLGRYRDYGDRAILALAARGLFRTDPGLLRPENLREPPKEEDNDPVVRLIEKLWDGPSPAPSVAAEASPVATSTPVGPLVAINTEASSPATPPAGPRTLVDVLLHDPAFAEYVARLAGTTFRGHGKGVPCSLHPPDEHPSAAWYETPSGWALFCFHAKLILGLADVLAYLETRKVTRPEGVDRLALIQRAAHASGRLTALVAELLQANYRILQTLQPRGSPTNVHIYEHSLVGGEVVLHRVWEAVAGLIRENAEAGRLTALAPVDVVAQRAGVAKEDACRALNYLCALGLIHKTRGGCEGRAQAITLCFPDPEEVKRRARLLGSWRRCNRAHVAKVLGEEVAKNIFYGKPDQPGSPRLSEVETAVTQAHLEEASLTPEALAEPATPVGALAPNPVDPLPVPEVVMATPPEAVAYTPETSTTPVPPSPSPTTTERVRVVFVPPPQDEEAPPEELPAPFLQWLQSRHPFLWAIVRANPIRLAQAYAEWRQTTGETGAPNGNTPGIMPLSGLDPGRS